jgi:uncharacterized protein (TIGR04552 family)
MRTNRLDIDASLQSLIDSGIGLSDLEAVRLILSGNSVIDWNRANYRNFTEVDRFFSLHLLDLKDPNDARRIHYLHSSSITYLEEHLGLRFPDSLKNMDNIRELFVTASYMGGFRRNQILSCVILKLMHVIYHLEAAELRYQISLAESVLLDAAERRIMAASHDILKSNSSIVSFYGSRKARNSVITKLLAKRENIAATVFDKLRFRIVTESKKDILPVISCLSQKLFPFNYVIPGQSHNNLYSFSEMLDKKGYQNLPSNGIPEELSTSQAINSFSSSNYRNINFIVDFPVRIDHLTEYPHSRMLGRVVFVMVEFQIVDQKTALANESGDSAHQNYKRRQLDQVKRRLRKGGKKK